MIKKWYCQSIKNGINASKLIAIPPIIIGLNLIDTPIIIIQKAYKIKNTGIKATPSCGPKKRAIIIKFTPSKVPSTNKRLQRRLFLDESIFLVFFQLRRYHYSDPLREF